MKNLAFIFSLFLSFLMCAPVYAARVTSSTIISSTTLDDSPTSVSGSAKAKSADKIAFYVAYDETEVGNSVSLTVTVDVSTDNSTWLDASYYDYAGGSTLQTSETISADGNYYFWFNRDLAVPYVRIVLTGNNTDADDLAVVSAEFITSE